MLNGDKKMEKHGEKIQNQRRNSMTEQNGQNTKNLHEQKQAMDKRLESIGWAFFFVMSGILLVMPEGMVPEGAWLIGTGLIILVFSAIRYLYRIKIEGFWLVMGILFLSFGLSGYFSLDLPILPILLVLFGMSITYKAFLGKNRKWDGLDKCGEFFGKRK